MKYCVCPYAATTAGPRDHHDDAPDRPVEAGLVQQRAQRRRTPPPRAPRTTRVHTWRSTTTSSPCGERQHHPLHGLQRPPQVLLACVRGDQVDLPALERCSPSARRSGRRCRSTVNVPSWPDAVVAPREHLEHHLADHGRRLLEARREQLLERLRALDQRLDARLPVGAERVRAPAWPGAPPSSRRRIAATASKVGRSKARYRTSRATSPTPREAVARHGDQAIEQAAGSPATSAASPRASRCSRTATTACTCWSTRRRDLNIHSRLSRRLGVGSSVSTP